MKHYKNFARFNVVSIMKMVGIKSSFIHDKFEVFLTGSKFKVFQRSLICHVCGLKGDHFKLQKGLKEDVSPYLNLYGVLNGEDVMMTQDHIIPKSKGGTDRFDNLITMCFICNQNKSNRVYDGKMQTSFDLNKVRMQFGDENYVVANLEFCPDKRKVIVASFDTSNCALTTEQFLEFAVKVKEHGEKLNKVMLD